MISFNDDPGRGGGEHSAYFKTDEGRTYFIQMEELRERCNKIIGTLQSELIYLKTVRGANKNLRDVRAENRRTDEIK